MSKLQLTHLWFKIRHFTCLGLASLHFCNPPMAFPLEKNFLTSKYNIKRIKKLELNGGDKQSSEQGHTMVILENSKGTTNLHKAYKLMYK